MGIQTKQELPVPPGDKEKYFYVFGRRNKEIYTLSIISLGFLFTGWLMMAFIDPLIFSFYLAIAAGSFIYLLISYIIGLKSKDFDFEKHLKILAKHSDKKPLVDIYLPCCGEDLKILKNTQQYVKNINYPNFKVYVLDDKGDKRLEKLTKKNGFEYISRPNKGQYKKAGNLRYAFARTQADFILILDADFVPREDIINETLPYMFENKKISIVQTPQYFQQIGNKTEKAASYIQELFYRMIQVSRDTYKAPICCGSCALYRRKALAKRGGTYLIGHSEDLHTGFYSHIDGYFVKYLPLNLAAGLNPKTKKSFFNQQYRWCTGTTSLCTNKDFWQTKKLNKSQKICFLSGMLYYQMTALNILMLLVFPILVLFYPKYIHWYNLLFIIPATLLTYAYFPRWSRNKFSFEVIKLRAIQYLAHLFAIKDKLFGKSQDWKPTGSHDTSFGNYEKAQILTGIVLFASLGILFIGTLKNEHIAYYNILPGIAFYLFNFYVYASLFKEDDSNARL